MVRPKKIKYIPVCEQIIPYTEGEGKFTSYVACNKQLDCPDHPAEYLRLKRKRKKHGNLPPTPIPDT